MTRSVQKRFEIPGLSNEPSGKGFELWGRQTATRIIRRITRAPRAIPKIAALDIVTAKRKRKIEKVKICPIQPKYFESKKSSMLLRKVIY